MAHSNKHFEWLDNMLLPALILSVGLHMIGLVTLHAFRSAPVRPSPPLEVALQPPKLEQPAPKPEPPKPEQHKPAPKKAPPPPVKMPLAPPPKHVISAPAPSVTPPPPVMTASPTTDAESTFTAPSESEKPRGPSQQDIDSAIGDYGSLLAREFAKHKQYPRIAQMRGWQGTVRIKLEVDANGVVTSSTVSESSNFEALDKQALEMASKVTPLPTRPEALRHRPFSITVPVVFRLE